MTNQNSPLDSLRREIDRIDDSIHDLIMERAAMVEKIAAAKTGEDGIPLRPGREAVVLRRLLDRHHGAFPKVALIRMWREMMGALVGLQHPFSIAVCQPERGAGYIELARNHFGVVSPLVAHASPGQVVRVVADGHASVGVLPIPGPADNDAWWLSLSSDAENMPRVVARLPYAANPEGVGALVVACRPHEETGMDRTLVVIETVPDVSRDRMRTLLTGAGFSGASVLSTHRTDDVWCHMAELDGHALSEDERLSALSATRDPVCQVRVIGGYALPYSD